MAGMASSMIVRVMLGSLLVLGVVSAEAAKPDDCPETIGGFLGATSKRPLTKDSVAAGTTVWGEYKCNNCSSVASAKPRESGIVECTNCGTPHTNEPYFLDEYFQAKDIATREKELERANSGYKWKCSFCSDSNFATEAACKGCGAARLSGDSPDLVNPKGPKILRDEPTTRTSSSSINGKHVALATAGLATVGAGAYWALSSHPVEGKVTAMSWAHHAERQTFAKQTHREWLHKIDQESPIMPRNGVGERAGRFNVHNCRDEFFETEHYRCGTESYIDDVPEQVVDHYENTPVSNGNGSYTMEQTPVYRTEIRHVRKVRDKYCDRDIYKAKCDYNTYEWVTVETKNEVGASPTQAQRTQGLPWPEFQFGPRDRQMRSAAYGVSFTYKNKNKDGTYSTQPPTEQEFLSWQPGDGVTLQLRNIGTVKDFSRKPR